MQRYRGAHGFTSPAKLFDTVAALKSRQLKTKSEPWLNDMTHAVRRKYHRAERKKDKLQVFFQMLRDCWHQDQMTVKARILHCYYIVKLSQASCFV